MTGTSRHRSNTTGFSAFHWRRPRPSVPSLSGIAGTDSPSSSTPQTPQQPSLDLADLISSLTPPSVPSLAYARALTSLLPTAFPPPKRSLLAPIWISLCDPDVPAAIQAAGFDLLGAYFENEYREGLTTADRLTYFSLFTAAGEWAADTWEPRLKALRGMTVYGTDILGIEEQILDLLKSWIQSAFDGLLALEARTIGGQEDSAFQFHVRFNSDERNDRSERERCIILCAEFISKILQKSENLARIPDEGLTAIISFYGTLVDRAIQLPRTKGYDPASEEHDDPPSFQFPATSAPSAGPVLTGHQSHRRSASTSTSTSASTTVSTPVIGPVHVKHPAEIAVNLYLSYLSTQIKSLSPNSLQDIIPTLFRATAFCATPLSRLSIVARHQAPSGDKTQSQTSLFHLSTINDWKRETEDKITDFLAQLLSGPYASLSKLILKVWLGPPGTTPSVLNPPPLFFSGCQTPTQSPSLLPSLPFQAYPQVQQAQPRSSFGLTSLHNSPVPTQPATPNPPLDSLPALNIPQSLPTSPTAHFTMPHLPSVSSHLASLNLAQQSHPQLPTNAPLHTATSSSSSTGPTVPLPLHPTSSTLFTIHTCLGAHRTLRTTLRRSLISRLARAYMLRETSLGYIASGVATRADIDSEVTERAWPTMASVGGGASAAALGDAPGFSKELKGYEWDTVRIGRALKWAVKTWVEFEVGLEEGGIPVKIGVKDDIEKTEDREEKERLKDAVERVLEEVAGILKDLLQEVDDRSDGDRSGASWIASDTTGTDVPRSLMEEDESVAIGEALFELAGWIKRAKNPDGTPYVIRLRPQSVGRSRPSHSMSAFSRTSSASTIPTQSSTQNPPVAVATKRGSPSLILTLTTLLSRSHFATPLRPSLSLTLTSISGNLGDVDLAPLPDIMMRTSELNPTSLEWLDNWSAILGISDASEQSPSVGTVVGMTAVASGDKAQGLSWMERVVAERESGQWEQGRERLYEGGRGLVGLGSHLNRRKTREEVMIVLDKVYDGVRDMGTYRGALADVVCGFAACALTRAVDSTSSMSSSTAAPDQTSTGVGEVQDEFEFVWRLLADEVVLRIMEGRPLSDIEPFLDLLLDIAGAGGAANALPSATIRAGSTSDGTASGATSPATSRMQSEYASTGTSVPAAAPRENATGGSGLISSLLSLAAGTTTTTTITADDPSVSPVNVSTATQTTNTMSIDVTLRPLTKSPQPMVPSEAIHTARSQCGVFALVSIFGQLVFSPLMLEAEGAQLVVRVYDALLNVAGDIAGQSTTTEARLTALAFLMRLRADADHRVFLVDDSFDANSSVEKLAGLIGRLRDGNGNSHGALSPSGSIHDRGAEGTNRARTRVAQERVGRRSSRGRGQSTGPGASLRSLSRSPIGFQSQRMPAAATPTKPRDPLWYHPQIWPFAAESDLPSESVTTHNTAELEPPNNKVVLPVDKYLEVLINLLQNEKEWELISYALCHLPVQLANRRFFYGGKSPAMLSRIANVLCSGLLSKTLAAGSARQRDAQGLAHYTLEILISYWRCLDLQQRHMIVEVFLVGLNEQPSTVKCCLHALTLAAFELPVSITKYMPRILESLSQIMSNPDMAVYILAFLCIAVSLPPLYANFTEDDFKTVFGVALQYLQHYSRHNASPTVSWALSQHVRILSYYAIYIWFLAVRLPDRPRYIKFITRQLLIANEGNDSVDSATEVCFDWLARYTYATADPRPANSLLADILMNSADSTKEQQSEATVKEKTWVVGNAVVTIRALGRLGWLEVLTRRPSGFTKFLCRVENAPMVGPGEVDLDSISAPAVLLMERDPPQVLRAGPDDYESPLFFTEEAQAEQMKEIFDAKRLESQKPPRPDPVTGYIWKGSAPSQRRKEVVVDPSYFAIQLSPYPSPPAVRLRADQAAVPKFISTIDRVPVIDTHKVGILYVAPGQTTEVEILRNTHGSPAYTRFLEGLGRLISLRGQLDVYAGGLDPDEDGEYAYAWWDDIGQILYHTATMMPTNAHDPQSNNKKRHIGNDYVRIVWNDSGSHYRFDTLSTQFQFVNIVIEPHPRGTAATYSNTSYENEYFKVTVQRAPGMTEFVPVGNFKLISGQNLPLLVRQLGLLADWFASIFAQTNRDTTRMEVKTNWQMRLEAITRFKKNQPVPNLPEQEEVEGIMSEENYRDFTLAF